MTTTKITTFRLALDRMFIDPSVNISGGSTNIRGVTFYRCKFTENVGIETFFNLNSQRKKATSFKLGPNDLEANIGAVIFKQFSRFSQGIRRILINKW